MKKITMALVLVCLVALPLVACSTNNPTTTTTPTPMATATTTTSMAPTDASSPEPSATPGVAANMMDTLFAECDYITLHLPLNGQTRGMVNAARLGMMKEGAVLLNFSRGELVDTGALLDALSGDKLARYVTDFPNDEILCHPKVIAIPHLGASTPESEENCAQMAARELYDYLENGNITHSVNFPDCAMPRSDAHRLCVLHRNVANIVCCSAVMTRPPFVWV